jgi:hypothetical protein
MTDCLHKNENSLLLMPNLYTNIVIKAFSAGVAAGVSTNTFLISRNEIWLMRSMCLCVPLVPESRNSGARKDGH